MNKWICFFFFMAVFVFVMLILYRRGVVLSKRISPVLFVFRPGKYGDEALVKSCSGRVGHAGRFRESRTYEFCFDAQLSEGEAEALLLDTKKRTLMRLNRQLPTGRVKLDGKNRYYLRWEFKNATGKCQLRW